MELKEKILDAFNGKVVRKDLASDIKGNLPVPTYVLEYLLGQYCACDDPVQIEEGKEKVKEIVANNYFSRAQAEEVKAKIKEKGRYTIIDKISVVLNDKEDVYEASFANLGIRRIPISGTIVTKNTKLLSGNGVWCIVVVNYLSGDGVDIRWEIQSLKPIQISNLDLDYYIEQRSKFSTEEWIDLLIHSVGLDPENFNRRQKFIILSRLLPHIENNYNFIELGPKGTGKSHVYQEFSPYSVLVSGGDVTSARLFVKISGNSEILGLVGSWDVVTWDEYEQKKNRNIEAKLVDIMQNYLANKSFNRGKGTYEAVASMSFIGNIKHSVPYMLKRSHLFESIPSDFLQTGAFLDRIHMYNPGWEVGMLKKRSFSGGFGLITDYIAAVLHALRNRDYSALLSKYAKFDTSLSERDHLAIRKSFSGLVKLFYPNEVLSDEEAYELIDFATEGRKRVKDQLYIIDETFKAEPAIFEYEHLKNGNTIKVMTLEEIENQDIHHADQDFSEEVDNVNQKEKTTKKVVLKEGTIEIRMNQKGITYRSLFGDYLKTAKSVTIVDPWIRLSFQIDNLIELIHTIREVSDNPEELKIHLSTQNEIDKIPDMIDIFNNLEDELQGYGIEFSYDFNAVHDRWIELDNGWKILLSRGLDIFEKCDRFSLGYNHQIERRCRDFSATFNQIKNKK